MTDTVNICVIDDEQIVCERLRPVLEKSGFNVETFVDSAAALKRLSEKKFDILIITGFATAETARKAMKGGAVDFIAKPFRLSQLKDLVLKISKEIMNNSQ
jgi:FixJ family two-component response regulator